MYEFQEVQGYRQRVIWLVVVPPLFTILFLYSFFVYRQVVLDDPLGGSPLPDALMIALLIPVAAVTLGAPALLSIVRLVVRVNANGVEIMLVPFLRHHVPVAAIQDWRARPFDRLIDYPGLRVPGVRFAGKNRAYLMGTREGVELDLVGGRQIFIGSRRAEELDLALDRVVFGHPEQEPQPTPEKAASSARRAERQRS